jgi:hypothetical protein
MHPTNGKRWSRYAWLHSGQIINSLRISQLTIGRQGGYPVYVVNVTSVAQIQTSVNFAREFNVRLVVKNTGHDFSGKSLGAGALSIWTHVSLP